MKRLAIPAIFTLLLAACGGSVGDTPEAAIQYYYRSLIEQDESRYRATTFAEPGLQDALIKGRFEQMASWFELYRKMEAEYGFETLKGCERDCGKWLITAETVADDKLKIIDIDLAKAFRLKPEELELAANLTKDVDPVAKRASFRSRGWDVSVDVIKHQGKWKVVTDVNTPVEDAMGLPGQIARLKKYAYKAMQLVGQEGYDPKKIKRQLYRHLMP